MEKELNLLTQKLLAEGYTKDFHPDYVEVRDAGWGEELWQNLAGGFEYTPEYLETTVFKTGCGLVLKGDRFLTGTMFYMGIHWMPENDNPTINCPLRKDSCEWRNPVLDGPKGGGLAKFFLCDCHRTDEIYSYEKSVDKIRDDYEKEKKKKYDEFAERVKGHICRWHMYWSDWERTWRQNYDPLECARNCLKVGGICELTHRPVSKKKANIFYERKITRTRRDGTLFDGEEMISIEKGIRFFETAKSITICEEVLKRCKDAIIRRERDNYGLELYADKSMKMEILNIRIEQRESRDLLQDLQDIRAGIQITHASDLKKKAAQAKRERRNHRRKLREQRLENLILEVGYDSLKECSLDKIHADKWLGAERIQELEQRRLERIEEKKREPVQLSMFDMGLEAPPI